MIFPYGAMAAAGAAAAGWGLWAAHRLKTPWDIAAALAALCGLVAFVMGILLAVIPDFLNT